MLLNIEKSSGHGPNVAGSALVWPPPALRDTVRNANPSFCIMIPNVEIMLSSGGWTAGHMVNRPTVWTLITTDHPPPTSRAQHALTWAWSSRAKRNISIISQQLLWTLYFGVCIRVKLNSNLTMICHWQWSREVAACPCQAIFVPRVARVTNIINLLL